ncbi:MAG: hypothetical protein FJ316_01090 [SAR202 cluster bacterium]|nr:hypothetical protein [SAR202 cluster bacterium]
MAEAIQGALKAVGVKVNVVTVEQIDPALKQGDWDGVMYFTTMGISGDPYLNIAQYFTTGGGANFGGYSSPSVDQGASRLSVAAVGTGGRNWLVKHRGPLWRRWLLYPSCTPTSSLEFPARSRVLMRRTPFLGTS